MHNGKKTYRSPKEKVQLVLEGLKDPQGISAFCRRKGISEALFYKWQKRLLENADSLFEKPSKSSEKKDQSIRKRNPAQGQDYRDFAFSGRDGTSIRA